MMLFLGQSLSPLFASDQPETASSPPRTPVHQVPGHVSVFLPTQVFPPGLARRGNNKRPALCSSCFTDKQNRHGHYTYFAFACSHISFPSRSVHHPHHYPPTTSRKVVIGSLLPCRIRELQAGARSRQLQGWHGPTVRQLARRSQSGRVCLRPDDRVLAAAGLLRQRTNGTVHGGMAVEILSVQLDTA